MKERRPSAASFEADSYAQGLELPWDMQDVSELGDCGAAWLEADMDACLIPLPSDLPARGVLPSASNAVLNEALVRVPEVAAVRWPPPLVPVPHLSLDDAAAVDLDSSLSGDSWSFFDATDVDAMGMADLELPLLGDLLEERGPQPAPTALALPPASADSEQRWADGFNAASELSEVSADLALRQARTQVSTRRAGGQSSGSRGSGHAVPPGVCTAAPSFDSGSTQRTDQSSGHSGRAVLPLPVLAAGAVIDLIGQGTPVKASPMSLMPAINGPSPAALGGCARPRKCGRPRVYDTVTPVLEAAEVAAAGIPPPVRRCRGAKPKYVCHTEQEAVAKRRERNRAAALSSYYQRKARQQQLELEALALRSDLAALEVVLCRLQDSPSLGAVVRPLLMAGVAASDILLRMEPLQ